MELPNISNDERGQVGIGTLIIFIALVLVAAVAAGVLINTAGFLQASAESTGTDAQSQVSNQIDIVSATGAVEGREIETLGLVVKKSPGSDPIDLSDATIQYTSDTADATLVHDSTGSEVTFSTTQLAGDDEPVLVDTGDRVRITIELSTLGPIAEDEDVTLRIVDQSGATTVYGVNAPHTFGGREVVSV